MWNAWCKYSIQMIDENASMKLVDENALWKWPKRHDENAWWKYTMLTILDENSGCKSLMKSLNEIAWWKGLMKLLDEIHDEYYWSKKDCWW